MKQNIKQVSTRDLMNFVKNKTHSQIKKAARTLLEQGLIEQYEINEFVHWQNKNTYTEYLLSVLDIDLVIYELRPKQQSSGAKRKDIPPKTRKSVFDLHPQECTHCQSTEGLCIDHIVPVSRGGSNAIENLQILCGPCNCSKGTKLMHEWLEDMA